jgi:hypothetical protein
MRTKDPIVLQRRADRRWRRRATLRQWGQWWWRRRVLGLPAAGLLSIAYGFGHWSPIAGFIVLGIGFFVFEWRVTN